MSWVGDMLSNKLSNMSTTGATGDSGGVYKVVGSTTPSTYTSTHTSGTIGIVGPTPATYPYITTGINTGGLQNSYSNVHISGTNPTLSTDKVKIDINELGELINVLKERFLIITPDFEKHEKYAALKKAYDNYKLIESMLSGDNNDNK